MKDQLLTWLIVVGTAFLSVLSAVLAKKMVKKSENVGAFFLFMCLVFGVFSVLGIIALRTG